MNLWDKIKPNKKDIFQKYADNLQPLHQPVEPIQVQEGIDGGADITAYQPQMITARPSKLSNFKNKLADILLGDSATPTDSIDTNGDVMNVTISDNPRVGGLLNDIHAGAKENFATGFAANNLTDNLTPDGRNKGFAYRLGEGFGTAGRFLESPFGRGLLTAAAVGMAGGGAPEMLAYGLQGGSLNQQLRKADDLYRQQLKDNYGFTDEQLNSTRGYIRPDTFNNLTKSQNSAMNLALRQQTTQSMNRLRELQIEKQRIINSTLPEMEKAKLIKANAEAAHAEEMQLARINYYNNAVANPLGWANFGLKVDQYEDKKVKEAKEAEAQQKIIESLVDNSTPPEKQSMPKGRAF